MLTSVLRGRTIAVQMHVAITPSETILVLAIQDILEMDFCVKVLLLSNNMILPLHKMWMSVLPPPIRVAPMQCAPTLSAHTRVHVPLGTLACRHSICA